jgi:hypothetical protein
VFLLVAASVELGSLAGLAWWPSVFPRPGFLLFGMAWAAYATAAMSVARLRGGPGLALILFAVAVAARLPFLPLDPFLSDDVYRYLWDGLVQLNGINPFLHTPGDLELAALRPSWHASINHPHIPTIYPPLAQVSFLLIALLGNSVLTAKLLWIALDLGTGLLLWRIARITHRHPAQALVLYLWSPLLVVEIAWSGHLETLGLIALVALLASAAHPLRAGAFMALAALAKLAPAAALPPLARRLGWRYALAFVTVTGAFYLPYARAGSRLWAGFMTYVEQWEFNAGAFAVIELLTPDGQSARIVAGLLLLAVIVWTTVRSFDVERALFWILGAGILLSPTVHPWYVLWVLPLAALRASRPWILLSGLVFLAYRGIPLYLETGIWTDPPWVRLLIWVPTYLAFLWEALERRSRDLRPPGSKPGDAQAQVA